eukprot:gene9300-6539_t
MLTNYLKRRVSVLTVDGRNLMGVLHAADQLMNIVLRDCVERELGPAKDYFKLQGDAEAADVTEEEAKQKRDAAMRLHEEGLGVVMLRGADVMAVGLVDVHDEARHRVSDWTGVDMPPSVGLP